MNLGLASAWTTLAASLLIAAPAGARSAPDIISMPEVEFDTVGDCYFFGWFVCQLVCEDAHGNQDIGCDGPDDPPDDGGDDDGGEYDQGCLSYCGWRYDACSDGNDDAYDACYDDAVALCEYENDHGSGMCDVWGLIENCSSDYFDDQAECSDSLGACEETCRR